MKPKMAYLEAKDRASGFTSAVRRRTETLAENIARREVARPWVARAMA